MNTAESLKEQFGSIHPKLVDVAAYYKKPCKDCPFKKDTLKGWLGKNRMTEILAISYFVCHKNTHLQCAGHMLINDNKNDFVELANRMGINLNLTGSALVFESKQACIEHHTEP